MQRPTGGPRDLTPPKVVKATPENMTRNFTAKQIQIEFDEFYKLTNQYQEISISPAQEKLPEYDVSKKLLTIKFKDSLQKNTTYVINFGKAIADVNENNVLKNFTYVFSTGPHIDSLSITGQVFNTSTQEREKEATVFLFPISQDSLMFGKKKPTIFTSTDSAGNFSLNNLREDTYAIYALKEQAANKIYDNDAELIAFLKKPIKVDKDTSGIKLNLFKQTPEKFRIVEKRFNQDGKLSFLFNRPLNKPAIKLLSPTALDGQKIVEFTKTRDSAFVYMRNMDFDSLSVQILENGKALDTVPMLKQRKERFDRATTFTFNINKNGMFKPNTDLIIKGNLPIESFDKSYFTLTEDSVAENNFTLQKDTANLRSIVMKYRFRPGSKYELTFNEGAVTNIYGDKNKKSAIKFQGDKIENYSVLTLQVKVPEAGKSYVVEMLDDQKNLLNTNVITADSKLIYRNILTGKYFFRVIYDNNGNGVWDSGNVRRKTYPENIWLSDKEVTLRPNWDAEETLVVPKEVIVP
ncbi:Ig-like domain-containing protein [Mucilaginibacter pallidiroseus]|nr:Ig-like domain-containing protein [Mucilaginibacter pallidiroseus]